MEGRRVPELLQINGRSYSSTDVVHMKVGQSIKLCFVGTSNSFIHPMLSTEARLWSSRSRALQGKSGREKALHLAGDWANFAEPPCLCRRIVAWLAPKGLTQAYGFDKGSISVSKGS